MSDNIVTCCTLCRCTNVCYECTSEVVQHCTFICTCNIVMQGYVHQLEYNTHCCVTLEQCADVYFDVATSCIQLTLCCNKITHHVQL